MSHPAPRERREELFDRVYALLERRRPEQALEALESAPARDQRSAEFLYLRGTARRMLGDLPGAAADLERALGREADLVPVHLELAIVYVALGYLRHAWRAAERYLQKRPADLQGEAIAREVIATVGEQIVQMAAGFGVSQEKMELALYANEKAQSFLNAGDFRSAARETTRAIRALPNWPSPRNNRATALYYLGRLQEAVAESEAVLREVDPQNLYAMSNLILFHHTLWQEEQARRYAARMRGLLRETALESVNLPKVVESLALLDDDEALWELAKRMISEPSDDLPHYTWYILGAAAANTGHLKEAHTLLGRARGLDRGYGDWVSDALGAVERARKGDERVVGSSLRGRVPYLHFSDLWHPNLARKFLAANRPAPADFGRDLAKYVRQNPIALLAFRQILWNEQDDALRRLAVIGLAASQRPEAYDELKRFATSPYGTDEQRMNALTALGEKGQLPPEEKIRFWRQAREEWAEISLLSTRVEEEYEPRCAPAALALVEKSQRTMQSGGDAAEGQREAARYLKQAIELDPDCAIAFHNLGVLYLKQGKDEEGEALVRRSLEVDPGYLFACTTLAGLEMDRGNPSEAHDWLQRIFAMPSIPAYVLVRSLALQIELAVQEDEDEIAQNALDMLTELAPDYPDLDRLTWMVRLIGAEERFHARWLADVHRYRRRQLDKPISAQESLPDCLNRITREALTATLRGWALSTAGRKAEVIDRLAEVMTDPLHLEAFIRDQLTGEEREALTWILAGGGAGAWSEFTERFGDDFNESPYWQWHEPKTVPGRLRMLGLLAVGAREGESIAIIPYELRAFLSEILDRTGDRQG